MSFRTPDVHSSFEALPGQAHPAAGPKRGSRAFAFAKTTGQQPSTHISVQYSSAHDSTIVGESGNSQRTGFQPHGTGRQIPSTSVKALTESSAESPSMRKMREKCDSMDRVDSPIKPERDVVPVAVIQDNRQRELRHRLYDNGVAIGGVEVVGVVTDSGVDALNMWCMAVNAGSWYLSSHSGGWRAGNTLTSARNADAAGRLMAAIGAEARTVESVFSTSARPGKGHHRRKWLRPEEAAAVTQEGHRVSLYAWSISLAGKRVLIHNAYARDMGGYFAMVLKSRVGDQEAGTEQPVQLHHCGTANVLPWEWPVLQHVFRLPRRPGLVSLLHLWRSIRSGQRDLDARCRAHPDLCITISETRMTDRCATTRRRSGEGVLSRLEVAVAPPDVGVGAGGWHIILEVLGVWWPHFASVSFPSMVFDSQAKPFIVWEERMTQAKILSILSPQALKEQVYGYRIIELQNHLWRQERSVCLGLARVAGRPQDPAVASFLDLISTLQGFRPGPGLVWVVTELHEGKSWRAKTGAAPSGPASPVGGLQLGDGGWGPYRPDKNLDFLLMVHPWGSDALVLAQVSNSPTMQAESKGRCGKCDIQCALCFRSLAPHEIEQEPCFFHPGVKECLEADSSASEASDDDVVPSYPTSSTDSSEYDDLPHDEVLVYRCCGRRGDTVGCTAETRHMPIHSEHAVEWRGIDGRNSKTGNGRAGFASASKLEGTCVLIGKELDSGKHLVSSIEGRINGIVSSMRNVFEEVHAQKFLARSLYGSSSARMSALSRRALSDESMLSSIGLCLYFPKVRYS
ncbi:hypothetical protein M409DRAFT_61145 [Zasmidium cellare ATCC 36951]|uniref:Uncharacterized protein n=1 Tax=Zasmidium cellare ATCC 36951 TaxID=1080233 RepID=A0A6A6BYS2_ZASCE|nr:uncharacterized protein M409DRAFT_61145 [Zasmidium cellare ATCC 36951]KAF2159070.1 hypothetical protein M409DRAFT_61145 [Zasmidium cellare ATCC 36951]